MSESVPDVAQKWANKINTVTIGATAEQGGTRGSTVTLGGAGALPCMAFEGDLGNRPASAVWRIGKYVL